MIFSPVYKTTEKWFCFQLILVSVYIQIHCTKKQNKNKMRVLSSTVSQPGLEFCYKVIMAYNKYG